MTNREAGTVELVGAAGQLVDRVVPVGRCGVEDELAHLAGVSVHRAHLDRQE